MGLITEKAAVRLTVRFPFWCELFYSMNVIEVHKDDPLAQQIQTEATDGKNLWVNVEHFGKLKLEEQVQELVHELSHKMFLHATRQGFRDPKLWNVAADYAINALMKQQGFPLGSDWLYEAKYDGWLAEKIYADLVDDERKGNPPPQMSPKRADLRKPEGTPEQIQQLDQETQAVVDRAIENAKARGDLPAGIEQQTMKAYRAASEPWYNHLHRYMQSLSTSTYNWARLNRRTLRTHGFFSPHHYSEALGDVVLFIDGSGSCFSRAQQAQFAEHVNAIMAEAKPKRVVVYYFDTKTYPPKEYEPGALEIDLVPKGGGGTSFAKIFDQAEADGYCPDVAIVLTDMLGTMPASEPNYPVFWADVLGHVGEAPFGEYCAIGD